MNNKQIAYTVLSKMQGLKYIYKGMVQDLIVEAFQEKNIAPDSESLELVYKEVKEAWEYLQ